LAMAVRKELPLADAQRRSARVVASKNRTAGAPEPMATLPALSDRPTEQELLKHLLLRKERAPGH
jgi:hypothetical protein